MALSSRGRESTCRRPRTRAGADPSRRGSCRRVDKTRVEKDRHQLVFVGAGTSIRDRAKKAPSTIARVLGIEFRGHDLRRTAATKMAEAGVPRHHISAVLNHVEGGARVTRIYDRYNYDAEKRKALETWALALKAIVEPEESGKVLPFSASVVR